MEQVECVVVGAGVIGLSVARALARRGREVVILEKEALIGSGVSSRNSGVIHAGLYYPAGSLKAGMCVAGRQALYRFCEAFGVAHRRVGKLVVAADEEEIGTLAALAQRALGNGVRDLQWLSPHETRDLEPALQCAAALLSPSTGIIDVHDYLLALLGDAERHGALLSLRTRCTGGEILDRGIRVDTGGASATRILCRHFVNCAALGAQTLSAGMRGLPKSTIPPLHLAKGTYFRLSGRSPFARLVYPLPAGSWLGVHAGLDLGGCCRFGPDIAWVDEVDYDVDARRVGGFHAAIRRFWPELPDASLQPDYAGIRPKLTPPGAPPADFVVQTSEVHGIDGLVNLYGIESPGLTSSLALGDHVADLVCGG